MGFLKPTKTTFIIFGLLWFLHILLGVAAHFLANWAEAGWYLIALVSLPFYMLQSLGLPVGHTRGDWYSFPVPNALAWILIILIWSCVFYLVAGVIAAVLGRVKKGKVANEQAR